MASAFMYTSQVSAGEYLHPQGHHRSTSPTTSLSPTLVNDAAHYTERPSVKFTIPSGASDILNSMVVNPAGQSLYTISSNSKRTTLISCEDNVEVATVQWDRSSPRMVFRGKKMKCKAWLPLTGPENESRTLTHGDAQFTWMQGTASGHLIPANGPGVAVARWYINPRTDELILEIFEGAPVESRFLEAIVLSVVLLRSGRPFDDSSDVLSHSNPLYHFL